MPSADVYVPLARAGQIGLVTLADTDEEVADTVDELELAATLDDPRVMVVPAVSEMEVESVDPPTTIAEVVDEADAAVTDSWALVEFAT